MATHSFFSKVALGPKDPILGVSEAFVADADPRKINLGVGVYQNAQGKAEKLAVVQKVERKILDGDRSATYLPIDGLKEFGPLVQRLVFGSDHPLVASGAIATCQSIGGSGGLRVAADFLKQNLSIPEVWISDPTWDNHRAIFEIAGFKTHGYPWYDPKTLSFDEAAFLETLERIPAGSLVLLHGCCHNPTGIDPTPEQWKKIHGTIRFRGLVPLLDLAYQGLGEGRDADAFAVRLFSDGSIPFLVVSSYSKSFSLYSVRVGALSIVTSGA